MEENYQKDEEVEIVSGEYEGITGKIYVEFQNDFDTYMVDIRPVHDKPVAIHVDQLKRVAQK